MNARKTQKLPLAIGVILLLLGSMVPALAQNGAPTGTPEGNLFVSCLEAGYSPGECHNDEAVGLAALDFCLNGQGKPWATCTAGTDIYPDTDGNLFVTCLQLGYDLSTCANNAAVQLQSLNYCLNGYGKSWAACTEGLVLTEDETEIRPAPIQPANTLAIMALFGYNREQTFQILSDMGAQAGDFLSYCLVAGGDEAGCRASVAASLDNAQPPEARPVPTREVRPVRPSEGRPVPTREAAPSRP